MSMACALQVTKLPLVLSLMQVAWQASAQEDGYSFTNLASGSSIATTIQADLARPLVRFGEGSGAGLPALITTPITSLQQQGLQRFGSGGGAGLPASIGTSGSSLTSEAGLLHLFSAEVSNVNGLIGLTHKLEVLILAFLTTCLFIAGYIARRNARSLNSSMKGIGQQDPLAYLYKQNGAAAEACAFKFNESVAKTEEPSVLQTSSARAAQEDPLSYLYSLKANDLQAQHTKYVRSTRYARTPVPPRPTMAV